ncbi:MAG: hypothetical protein IKT04_03160 [Clostridia bacterium]|nr:hypothetical protein [Clostridia bacterium]MBR6479481.1 hypothetical protein [Clostridia bacterium]
MDELKQKIKKYGKIAIIVLIILAILGIAIFALLIYAFFGVLMPYYNVPNDNKYVTAYDPGSGLVSQATYDALINSKKAKKLELGVNKDGQVVFQHPYKAFGRAAREYKAVWKYGDKKLKMKHLSRTFYMDYKTDEVINQIIEANPDLKGDAKIYQEILEIYSHSYNKHR